MSHSLVEELDTKLKVEYDPKIDDHHREDEKIDLQEDDDDDEEEEEEVELVDATDEEFSFVCGVLTSPIAAEEAFDNGHIRPFFPLFNKDLLLSDIDFQHLKNRSPVDKVFIETEDNTNHNHPPTTSSSEEISGPYCEWSKRATNHTKKSNSTGFSKLWRFRDFINRSNSDGRDAFVFLNNPTTSSTSSNVVKKDENKILEKKEKISTGDEVQVKKVITHNKKKIIKKSEAVLAHEAYMKSRAKDMERRRSYRPDPFGFFTNVNGGLTRNVHPF
ncbi:hypothetical protein K7X08_031552 [Anisodus acutangulus]|uniref:Uncharacterized protein n=1 Tax=Anisodus acutangulus TaxID=402998 RepID=A0A9Q1MLA8_9SOLA|nr:hypothetical protein K7X08_031552 [Anisodus acutangulus]